ncbi:efflux RND transporter periplasmic adaptor subunit [Pleomorphomonas sp. PLEO]|uniref:efflux RND transporter periplasmic adaptor subunit n=1 Tax=Pleomorphomonas sp. PLEO TaxID=3239306 RepID=UPI00351E9B26
MVIIAAGAGAWGWWKYANQDPLAGILTAQVTRADIEVNVLAQGTLRPTKLVAVGAQVSGRLTSMKVAVGQTLKKGDLIAEIDDVAQQNALKTNSASLKTYQASLAGTQATLTHAMAAVVREKITEADNATSTDALEVAQTLVTTTQYEIVSLQAQILVAQIAIDTANVDLAYTRILAPIDGMVLLVATQEGQTVNAAQSAPTIIIMGQVDRMKVRAEINEADVTTTKPGQPVYFTILGDLTNRWDSKLASIDPAPDALRSDSTIVATTSSSTSSSSSSTTSQAIYYYGNFDVPNPDGKLLTFMTAQVRIVLGSVKGVLSVPTSAVSDANAKGERSVEVVDANDAITSRAITTGLDDKVRIEVLTGLKEGERVVSSRKSNVASTSSASAGPPGGGL